MFEPTETVGGNIAARSPAKLNLFLHILGKRADNYHNLQTFFLFADWYDYLSLREAEGDTDEIRASGVFAGDLPAANSPNHLLRRVFALVRRESGRQFPPLRAAVQKNIPVAAGLGGGSGNAACLLFLLNLFLRLGMTGDDLLRLAAKLGSDVPAFVGGEHALAEGRGEILMPADTAKDPIGELHYLLICPRLECSTARLFSQVTSDDYVERIELYAENIRPHFWLGASYQNSFLRILLRSSAEFRLVHSLVCAGTPGKLGGRVFLSGSGSSLFVVYKDTLKLKADEVLLRNHLTKSSPLKCVIKSCRPI